MMDSVESKESYSHEDAGEMRLGGRDSGIVEESGNSRPNVTDSYSFEVTYGFMEMRSVLGERDEDWISDGVSESHSPAAVPGVVWLRYPRG